MEIKPTKRALEMLSGEVATEHDMRDLIADLIQSKGTQAAVARELGISHPYLLEMMQGQKCVGGKAVLKLGWERVVVYVKRGEAPDAETRRLGDTEPVEVAPAAGILGKVARWLLGK